MRELFRYLDDVLHVGSFRWYGRFRGDDKKQSGLFPPIYGALIDGVNLFSDSAIAAEFVDGAAAIGQIAIVVEDGIAAGGKRGIEIVEDVAGGLIKIGVHAQNRQLTDRCGGQGIREEAFEELDLIVEQTVAGKIVPYGLEGNRHVAFVPGERLVAAVNFRKSGKGIGGPDLAVRDLIGAQHGSHEDGHAAAPNARLDEISGNIALNDVGDGSLHMIELANSQHGFGILDAIFGGMPGLQVIFRAGRGQPDRFQSKAAEHSIEGVQEERFRRTGMNGVPLDSLGGERASEDLLQQIEIQLDWGPGFRLSVNGQDDRGSLKPRRHSFNSIALFFRNQEPKRSRSPLTVKRKTWGG